PPDQHAAPGIDHGTEEISRVECWTASLICRAAAQRRVPVIPLRWARPSVPKRDGRDKPGHDEVKAIFRESQPLRPNRSMKVAKASSCCLTRPRVVSSLISPVLSSRREAQVPTKISGLFMVKASRNTIILRRSY